MSATATATATATVAVAVAVAVANGRKPFMRKGLRERRILPHTGIS
jgi:hypothetical protein